MLSALASIGLEPGGYMIPQGKPGTSMDESTKMMKDMEGKPWAKISYYGSWHMSMGMNMARGLLANIMIVCLLCWIFSKMGIQSFSTYLLASIFIGIICFTNGTYTGHIWYPLFDISAHLIDALVSWGLVGLWLGWWMSRRK